MAAIARRAGVVRATVYVHYPTREALIEAVTRRAVDEAAAAIAAAAPESGPPAAALRRTIATAWSALGRYHALVAINSRLPEHELRALHGPVLAALEPLIERGRRTGAFRTDAPAAWQLTVTLALVHAASAELRAGRMDADAIGPALADTVLGALAA